MEQKLVRVSFDIELAKKITSGDIPGKVVTRSGYGARIICWNRKSDSAYHIVALLNVGAMEEMSTYDVKGFEVTGEECDNDLFLDIPEYLTFKDGDIYKTKQGSIAIYNGNYKPMLWHTPYYVGLRSSDGLLCFQKDDDFGFGILTDCTHDVTESEKQQFIDALKASTEPKAKEYLKRFFGIDAKQEYEFNPFDRVLVRQSESDKWEAMLFSNYTDKPHRYRCGGMNYMFCIPYEGNEDLIDTNKSPEDHE